jgi:hypothetical protein
MTQRPAKWRPLPTAMRRPQRASRPSQRRLCANCTHDWTTLHRSGRCAPFPFLSCFIFNYQAAAIGSDVEQDTRLKSHLYPSMVLS